MKIDDVKAHLDLTGAITGQADAASKGIAQLEEKLGAYQEAVTGDATLLVVFGNTTGETYYPETTDSQNCGMLDEYGLAECLFELPENAGAFGAFGYAEFTQVTVHAEHQCPICVPLASL